VHHRDNTERKFKNRAIPPRFDILLVLALDKPQERVMIERVDASGNTEYWRDNEGIHHVPKRSLEDIIIG
jgi:hypothetical protein